MVLHYIIAIGVNLVFHNSNLDTPFAPLGLSQRSMCLLYTPIASLRL